MDPTLGVLIKPKHGEDKMTDNLMLKLNDTIVEITMDDNGRYCLNDLFKASGSTMSKKPNEFFRHNHCDVELIKLNSGISRPLPQDFDSYAILTGVGRGSKTFAPLKVVYKYTAFISKEFENAVYDAFTALTKGDVQKAANIASSVTLSPEIIAKQEKVQRAMIDTIQQVHGNDPRWFSNYHRLISKSVFGYTPKELTNGISSTVEWIKTNNSLPAMNAVIASQMMVINLMQSGIHDYHVIASALGVSTKNNKTTLAKIDKMIG